MLGSLKITIDSAKDLLIKDETYFGAKEDHDGKKTGNGSGYGQCRVRVRVSTMILGP